MRVKVDIAGIKELTKQLGNLTGNTDDAMRTSIVNLATETRNDAVNRIQSGPKSGRVYVRGGVTHQASAPGQAPATDTGLLSASIDTEFEQTKKKFSAVIGTALEYGLFLELGTSKMAARPWLLKAFAKTRSNLEKVLKAEIEKRMPK